MIQLDQVSFRYPRGDFHLSIPELSVQTGESVAFTGPSSTTCTP